MNFVLIESQNGQRRYINLDTVVDALYTPPTPERLDDENLIVAPEAPAEMLLHTIAAQPSGYSTTHYQIPLRGKDAQTLDRALWCSRANKKPGQTRPEYLDPRGEEA